MVPSLASWKGPLAVGLLPGIEARRKSGDSVTINEETIFL